MSRLNRRDFMAGATLLASGAYAAAKPEDERFLLLNFQDPLAGQEARFDSWWSSHRAAMARVPGVVAADGYLRRTAARTSAPLPVAAHMTMYWIVTRDLAGVYRAMQARMDSASGAYGEAVDPKSVQTLSYHLLLERNTESPQDSGNHYVRMVIADPVAGREQEFSDWYNNTHSRELIKRPGVQRLTRWVRTDKCPTRCDASPTSLSLWQFRAASDEQFFDDVAKSGKPLSKSDSYDSNTAWRLTYQRVD